MPAVEIRPATRADIPAILSLLRELATYERLLDRVSTDEALIEQHIFSERRVAESWLALLDGNPVCYTIFYPVLPSFRGRPWLYLEDIYVKPGARRHGIGRRMMARLAQLALERGWVTMAWGVLDWNEPAFQFYRSLGAVRSEIPVQMELNRDGLERLARESSE
jgi:GNAT superfamily N-acetyltransferase